MNRRSPMRRTRIERRSRHRPHGLVIDETLLEQFRQRRCDICNHAPPCDVHHIYKRQQSQRLDIAANLLSVCPYWRDPGCHRLCDEYRISRDAQLAIVARRENLSLEDIQDEIETHLKRRQRGALRELAAKSHPALMQRVTGLNKPGSEFRVIRCSGLPLLARCAASGAALDVVIETTGDASALGSAVHEHLAGAIAGQLTDAEAMPADVDPDEFHTLCRWAWSTWTRVAHLFPTPEIEVAMKVRDSEHGIELLGHCDVLSATDGEVRVLDHKTGRLARDHVEQLKGYAWLALHRHPQCDRAYGAVLHVRDRQFEEWHWSRDELTDWWRKLTARLGQSAVYSPGYEQCAVCPRGVHCPAKTALLRQAVASLLPLPARTPEETNVSPLSSLAPEELGALVRAIKLVEDTSARVRELVKAEVFARGRRLAISDSEELVIAEQIQRRLELIPEVRDALTARLDAADWPQIATVSKTALEKVIKARAPHGHKEKGWEDLFKSLAAHDGAVRAVRVERLEIKRTATRLTLNPETRP